jgi:hypothetical protein
MKNEELLLGIKREKCQIGIVPHKDYLNKQKHYIYFFVYLLFFETIDTPSMLIILSSDCYFV